MTRNITLTINGKKRSDSVEPRMLLIHYLREEVGLEQGLLGAVPRFVDVFPASAFGLDVAVFAAPLRPGAEPPLSVDPVEVDSAFWLPRAALEHTGPVPRNTRIGTIEVEAALHEGHVLWGFTLRVLRELFDRLEAGGGPSPTDGVRAFRI